MDRWSTAERLCGLLGGELAQHGRFGLLRGREALALRRDGVGVWRGEEGPRAFLTTVVRVPTELAARVRAAAQPAAPAGADQHYLYPAGAIHITLANLDRYADLPLERVAAVLAHRVGAAPPITFTLRGLAVARHTVYVRAYARPASAPLALRASILRDLETGPPRQEPLRIAVSNVVRFRCADLTAVPPAVHACRNACFGSFPLHRVELVRTDKVLSAAGTELLAAFDTTS
ncbi:2'-5' RNA ligase family protein [Pseudofrankia sp. DC12]|uniref:2'-5' RNA ligase family protein n=1 Tax=Pseudofrankia sp. DC12 TaxID=683315 RepID=UPI0005F80D04|nr:2'-5' RNA ligase family protein [Pseudofrankia sp. DC12]